MFDDERFNWMVDTAICVGLIIAAVAVIQHIIRSL